MKQMQVPASVCQNCGTKCDGATGLKDDECPSPGDYSICVYCGHLMIFSDGLVLRNPTDEEIISIAGDPALIMATAIAERYRKEKK